MRQRFTQATVCAIGVSVLAAGASAAQTALCANPPPLVQASPEWAKDVTVLVIAPDGTWGVATDAWIHRAITKAIANCKSKYHGEIGCGYRFTSIRAGWSFAMRCGRENIIIAAKTLNAAEQAAIDSELDLRRGYLPNMPPCVRVLSVDPEGGIIAPDVVNLLQFVDWGR